MKHRSPNALITRLRRRHADRRIEEQIARHRHLCQLHMGVGLGITARGPVNSAEVATGGFLSLRVLDSTQFDPRYSPAISPDGNAWVAEVTLKGITDIGGTVDATKLTINVSDPGYTTDGSVTTRTRAIKGTVHLRKQSPNGDSKNISTDGTNLIVLIALSDWIYDPTTIVSATIASGFYTGSVASTSASNTNLSTEVYPKAGLAWINLQNERISGDTVNVEISAAHRHAQQGQQVACIQFTANDGSIDGATVTAGTTALSALQTNGNIAEVYKAAVSLAGLTNSAICTINARAYPWLGDSTAIMDLDVDGYNWPTYMPLQPLRVFHDSGDVYGGAYAYVRTGASAGTVSATASTARADPYPTIVAALAAIRTWNNANKSHNDLGGATVRLMDATGSPGPSDTHYLTAALTNAPGSTHCIVEPDPLNVGTMTVTALAQRTQGSMMLWRNLRLYASAANLMVGPNSGSFYADGCTFDNSGGASRIMVALFEQKFIRNFILTGGTVVDFNNTPSAGSGVACLIGGTINSMSDGLATGSNTAMVMIGNTINSSKTTSGPAPATYANGALLGDDGRFIYNNRFTYTLFRNQNTARTINNGPFFLQNVFELDNTAGIGTTCCHVLADNDVTTARNVLFVHNTTVGDRLSWMYNDIPQTQQDPHGIAKRGCFQYNVVDFYGCKSDTFANGSPSEYGSVGNWSMMFGVGYKGNALLFGTASRLSIAVPLNGEQPSFLGCAFPAGNEYNVQRLSNGANDALKQADVMDNDFTSYTVAPRGTPARGGNYQPKNGTTRLKNYVAANEHVLRYDIAGNARKSDGTGSPGAFEYAAA